MATIVTYDIPSKHVEFKSAMFALGYKDKIPHDGKIVYLPNTTLYHASKDATSAKADAKNTSSKLSVKLERCVATQWGPNGKGKAKTKTYEFAGLIFGTNGPYKSGYMNTYNATMVEIKKRTVFRCTF